MTALSGRLRSVLDEHRILSGPSDKVVPNQAIAVVPNQTIVLKRSRINRYPTPDGVVTFARSFGLRCGCGSALSVDYRSAAMLCCRLLDRRLRQQETELRQILRAAPLLKPPGDVGADRRRALFLPSFTVARASDRSSCDHLKIMTVHRQNSALSLVDPLSAVGSTLDELLGPRMSRPGELCEPLHQPVDASFRTVLKTVGLPLSVGVTLVVERELILSELGQADRATHEAYLDDRAARAVPTTPLSPANADYARNLLSALNGHLAGSSDADSVVVPSRLVGRIRSQSKLDPRPQDLPSAMRWELAAVRHSRTMTEWALFELLVESGYRLAAARQSPAASAAS